jgi:hypothetical protein
MRRSGIKDAMKDAATRMRAYRQRMRAQGLRRIELWVPDMRKPDVRARLRRQFRVIACAPVEPEIEAMIETNLEEIEGWKV